MVSSTLLRLKREGGISLEMLSGNGPQLALREESPGFSRVAAGNKRFLLSYDVDLRNPLVLPQGCQVSIVSYEGPLGIPIQSVTGPRASSGV